MVFLYIFQHLFVVAIILFIILGATISLTRNNPFFQIIMVILFGMIAGAAKTMKQEARLPYSLLMGAFMIGYIIFSKATSKWILITLFIIGFMIGKIINKHFEDKK